MSKLKTKRSSGHDDISECIKLRKACQAYSVECGSKLRQLSQSSFMQYIGLCVFSKPMSFMMTMGMRVLDLIIIIRSEEWPICHCFGFGHETIVYGMSIFCILCFIRYTFPYDGIETLVSRHKAFTCFTVFLHILLFDVKKFNSHQLWRVTSWHGFTALWHYHIHTMGCAIPHPGAGTRVMLALDQ